MDNSTSAKILVIGDDSNFCYLMRRYVRQSSHEVASATSWEDGLGLARQNILCAIIIEADIPGSAGWSLLKALKTDENTCAIPVILCSWKDDAEDYRSKNLKADVRLRKPVLYDDFITALDQIGIPAGPK